MWSKIVLCLVVGLAYATNNPGWKTDKEYVYQVNGRTLASLNDAGNQFSGIFLRAQLRINPKESGELQCQLSDVQYAQVHSQLQEGWKTHIPESELTFKSLSMSGKPFKMITENGIIKDIIVERRVSNWEANIIKSIASQFQIDTNAKNLVHSKINVLPEEGKNNAVFKTMEDTVTGRTETMYEINPLPEYIIQSQPWLMPQQKLLADGEVIEVVKHKNYSRSEERPSYHYGFAGVKGFEPTSNQIEDFIFRSSESRAILSGKLQRYTIQNSYTIEKIFVSPDLYESKKGSVMSMLNVSLSDVRSETRESQKLQEPVSLGNLVYTYDKPFASNNEVVNKQEESLEQSNEYSESESASQERLNGPLPAMRFRRSLQNINKLRDDSSRSSYKKFRYQQQQPRISEAPQSPLLPYTTGQQGNSIKQDGSVDVQQNVRRIAQEIGQEMQQQPRQVLVKGTLSKFVIMTSLLRLMSAEELKQTAQTLYSQEQQGQRRDTWVAFRDAVAQAGTGPAFLTIKEWIESEKIKGEEAADVVSVMAQSVRTPTEEYMREFFELTRKVQSQEGLNSTCLLAYTDLLREVYVDKKVSHSQFPVHSFGSFNTKEGRTYMKETVIPHLTEKLREAISNGDVRKIHLYIRALGNVGHKQILEAFEPYLEGHKQCSQTQRLMMVAALDKLVVTNPLVARSVLYKIYQNSGEYEPIRVMAVYKLMNTSPSTDMLQRMAEYTNVDAQEHVNAAVKTSILNLSKLEGNQYQYIRSSAKAAVPLLTKQEYGRQQGVNYLRNQVAQELSIEFKHSLQEIGSPDSLLPQAIRYHLTGKMSGLKQQFVELQALVSSVEQLADELSEQTESYKQEKQQKQQQQSRNSQFATENIIKQLNLQREEREQLEGSLLMKIASLQQLWSFDNKTVAQLPQVLRKLEETLKEGKNIHYSKFINKDLALSFPTVMGLPFLFTLDMPVLTHVEGTMKVVATPQISQGSVLKKPESLSAKCDVRTTLTSKVQSAISFVTPFDHQHYIAGNEKVMQIHVPVNVKIDVDLKKMQVKAEITPTEVGSDDQLLHFSQWPFTSRNDIMAIVPVSLSPNTKRIREENQHAFDRVIGKEQTGMAFRVWGDRPYASMDILKIGHLLKEYDIQTAAKYLWDKLSLQHSEFNVAYLPQQSSVQRITIRFGYQAKYSAQREGEFPESFKSLEELDQLRSETQHVRQQGFLNHAISGIRSVIGKSYDMSVEFSGQKEIRHILTVAVGKSNVDAKSRAVIYYENDMEAKPFRMALQVKNEVENTNELNLEDSLENQPKQLTSAQLTFGRSGQSEKKIRVDAEAKRSEERKEHITKQHLYQQCKKEMKEGNKCQQACERLIVKSNFLDRVKIQLKHENMEQEKLHFVKDMFHALRAYYFPLVQIKDNKHSKQNEIEMEIRCQPDLSAFNVSVKTINDETLIQNLEISNLAKHVLVPHPVFHLRSRVAGMMFGYQDIYRPTTVVDQTAVKTFDNVSYPISLGEQWTVLMKYVPKQARKMDGRQESVQEQLRRQVENYAILVRKNQQNGQQRDVMLIVNTPKTQGKDMEIELKPTGQKSGSSPCGIVKINGQQIQFTDKQAHEESQGFIEVYALPNGEVKIEVSDAFYVIYDGERVKVTALNSKLRDSVVGLSGNFDDNKMYELVTPEECVVRDSRQFVDSYKLEGKERTSKWSKEQCRTKVQPQYVNVISDQDAGRIDQSDNGVSSRVSQKCTKYQTRYVERDGEICFTIRPMPVCQCQQRSTMTKNVAVHCVQKSNVAQLWKTQIDKGASPDFLHKKETGTIEMELPQECHN